MYIYIWHVGREVPGVVAVRYINAIYHYHIHIYIYKGWRMVNARLCETARPAFFFASPRHFDFLADSTNPRL